jgi:hypothetical protein
LDCPLIAAALGDVDVQYVWRFLRAHKIDLLARKSWCESNDPDFAAKAAEIVGLYLAPPENAIVIWCESLAQAARPQMRGGMCAASRRRCISETSEKRSSASSFAIGQ